MSSSSKEGNSGSERAPDSPAMRAPSARPEGDGIYMGSAEDAEAALIAAVRKWRELRQPIIAPASIHKRVEAEEREMRFRLANAALLWLWHIENPEPDSALSRAAPPPDDASGLNPKETAP